ncbi:ABC transporter ATP-binding protein [Candidatus Parcubacteria bacterium]|nr:ABC transporter ATP-binding protein [Candidatus Parcubacteria bacterium]
MNSKKEIIQFSWLNLIKSIFFLLDKNKKKYIFWISILSVLFFYSLVPPLLLGKIVDFFTSFEKGDSLNTFYFLTALLGGLYALVSFLRLTTKRFLSNITIDVLYGIRVKGFDKLLAQSLLEHKDENTGAKVQKIENGTRAFQSLNNMFNNRVYPAIVSVVGMALVFAVLSPIFIIFLLFYIVGFFIIVLNFNKKLQQLHHEKNKATEKASGSYIEGLGNILTIKSSGAEGSFKNSITEKEEITRDYRYKIIRTSNNMWKVHQIFNGLGIGVFLFFVGHGVALGSVSVGSIIIFYSYIQQLIRNANQILEIYSNLIDAKTTFGRMMPIFWNKRQNIKGNKDFPKDWQSIVIKSGNFTYKKEERDKVHTGIYDMDLQINKKEKIGFAGKTGSGKSTIVKLLIGLYPFDSGDYQINDTNFYDIKSDEVLKNVTLVLQESEMFNLSMKDNITLMREYDSCLFKKAVAITQLKEVIEKLPNGIDTLIGEKGYHLSVGERQRVGIARAIYRNSQIIIFDEATSSLDSRTEKLIHNAIESEFRNKTLIFIAHRVSTLKNVDSIYVFDKGKIIEQGKYLELLEDKNSFFYKINKSR